MSNHDKTGESQNTNYPPDALECEVEVTALIEHVWDVVSTPGWWIVDCVQQEVQRIKQDPSEFVILNDAFRVDRLHAKEPEEVSFRWSWIRDEERPVTTVNFYLTSTQGGTRLRVRESGLSTGGPKQVLARHYLENKDGWQEQLELAKQSVESRE